MTACFRGFFFQPLEEFLGWFFRSFLFSAFYNYTGWAPTIVISRVSYNPYKSPKIITFPWGNFTPINGVTWDPTYNWDFGAHLAQTLVGGFNPSEKY